MAKVQTKVRGKRRFDGSTRVKVSRFQGRGGRQAGCTQTVRPAGVWSKADRQKMFDKFQDLDIDLNLLAFNRMRAYHLTINNTKSAPEQWLRGSDILTKVRRTLTEHVYKNADIFVCFGYGAEEFGANNRPHIHIVVFVPAPLYATPRWRGEDFEDPGKMLEAIGRDIIARAQPGASAHELGPVAKAVRIVASNVTEYGRRLTSLNAYLAKVGPHEDKADQKMQDLGADKVFDNDRAMSGYFGVKRVPDQDILVVDEDNETGVLTVIAEAGWSLAEGDAAPKRGARGQGDKIMSAGAVVGRYGWQKLKDALSGLGTWIRGIFD